MPTLERIPVNIDQIKNAHRKRNFVIKQRKAMDAALGAFIRMALGWSLAKPENERKEIEAKAAEIIAACEGEFAEVIAASHKAREPFDMIEKSQTKDMIALAEQLPIYAEFCKPIRGFGALGLAIIIGEAGDLSKYPKVGHLWKRMGVGLVDGVRQGGLDKSASKDDWIKHGYNRERRSKMWTIGDSLLKGNRDGEYRQAYLQRKEYEIARDPEIKKIVAHRRAQRYMEKRLLKKLWQAWRRTNERLSSGPNRRCPPQILEAA